MNLHPEQSSVLPQGSNNNVELILASLADNEDQEVIDQNPQSKILIIDDDNLNIQATSELIKQFNVTSTHATNGLDAIQIVKNRLKANAQGANSENPMFQLILCDYSMPDLDGFTCLKAIRQLCLG